MIHFGRAATPSEMTTWGPSIQQAFPGVRPDMVFMETNQPLWKPMALNAHLQDYTADMVAAQIRAEQLRRPINALIVLQNADAEELRHEVAARKNLPPGELAGQDTIDFRMMNPTTAIVYEQVQPIPVGLVPSIGLPTQNTIQQTPLANSSGFSRIA
jgi:hypothetical protein